MALRAYFDKTISYTDERAPIPYSNIVTDTYYDNCNVYELWELLIEKVEMEIFRLNKEDYILYIDVTKCGNDGIYIEIEADDFYVRYRISVSEEAI